jgi:5-(carboxyamino)imidazole ribonucleotide mutase
LGCTEYGANAQSCNARLIRHLFFAIDASGPIRLFGTMATPLVGIIMGSTSDWETMQHCAQALDQLGIAYEKRVLSAHRTPHAAMEWCGSAESRGLKVIIAAAGGAAHLAGVAAAMTPLPVLAVPMESASLKGLDSLLSMVQMPAGVPVATFAIGKPGAINAGLFAAAILARSDAAVKKAVDDYRKAQTEKVLAAKLP